MFLRKVLAQSLAELSPLNGIKCPIIVNQSTTTIIWFMFSDSGNATIKSTEIERHGA